MVLIGAYMCPHVLAYVWLHFNTLTYVCVLLGAIAASVFIAFLLVLYAVLWKCMVSPPQR